MGQGGDFLQSKKYDLDAWHGYDKKPSCKRWHDSFFSGKNGVFLGGSPCIYTLGITSGYFLIDFFMLNLDKSRL